MTYDNNYFDDVYQGIPVGGYTRWIEKMLEGTEVRLNVNYLDRREEFNALADKIVYTGPIDEFYGYSFGKLEYRTVEFKTERYEIESYQGNAVVNYTDRETPWTRIIEHKHFEGSRTKFTLISKEFSTAWDETKEPYYPVNDEKTRLCSNDTSSGPGRIGTYFSAVDWDSTGTTTWIRLSRLVWKIAEKSLANKTGLF